MKGQIRLAIGIPAYGGQINAAQARMWTEIGNTAGASERFRLTMFGFADVNPVDRARNQLLAQAMRHSSHWLFMIDADTWVETMADEDAGFQVLRMISDADRAGCVLVSAPVVKRSTTTDDLRLAVYGETDGKHIAQSISWLDQQPRTLVPVHAIGAACYAVNLTKLVESDPPIMYRFEEQLSEDLDFCRQIREAKLCEKPIMVDPRVRTGHQSRSFPLYSHEA